MKQSSISALISLLTLVPTTLLAKDIEQKPLETKLISVSTSAALEKEDSKFSRLYYSEGPEVKLTYLLKTKNIIEVIKNSIVTKNSKGWKIGSHPKITRGGNAVSFIIQKEGDFLGKPNETNVEGTVEILIGNKLIPKSLVLLSSDEPVTIDNFVFTLLEDKLKIEGNHKLIKGIIVEYNDQILNSRGSTWSGKTRTYKYKGIGKGAQISFSYWDEVVTKKVHFSNK